MTACELITEKLGNVNGIGHQTRAEQWREFAPDIIGLDGKRPLVKGWLSWQGSTDYLQRLERAGANYGLLARRFPAIDIDITAPGLANVARRLALETFGEAPTRTRRDSPKCLLMYRGEGLRKRRMEFRTEDGTVHAVELLGRGQQVAVDGIHPDGCRYEWDRQPNPGDLTTITAEQWETYARTLADRLQRIANATILKDGCGGAAARVVARQQDTLLAPSPEEALDALRTWAERRGAAHGEHMPHDQFVELCAAFRGAVGTLADELYDDFRELAPGGRDVDENTWKTYHSFGDVSLGWSRLQQLTDYVPATLGVVEEDEEAELPEAPEGAFSHDALARRFAILHADDMRFVASRGKWFEWSAGHWCLDEKLHAMTVAREVCRQAAQHANANLTRQLLSSNTIAGVEHLARSGLAITADDFDRDPWLLNTPAGTVDLKTGHMREHRRGDYITKVTAVGLSVDCPRWLAFVDEITGHDRELAGFIQRMLGYALTGSTQEQCLFFLYGRGANGKSVLLNTVASVLNDYHTTAPIETFTASNTERHPTELAGLRGARLVTAIETEEGRRWDETKVKALTGGDKIAARFMRGDFFQYTPQFKLIIAGNHKPALRTVDEAIQRRFHLVPFTTTIPAEKRDKNLVEKLKAEWPGILRWMVEGCLAWQREGLNPPAAVRDATREYLEAEDDLAAWISDCCICDPDAWGGSTVLYRSWLTWAKTANAPFGSQRAFAQKLEARFKPHRTNSGRGFMGLKVRENCEGVAW
jgi:putative DNA primase/helicase